VTTLGGTAAAATGPGLAYNLMVLLHVVCVVGGFGPIVYRSYALELSRKRGDAAAAGMLAAYGQVSQVSEVLMYGVLVFGLAAVGTSSGRVSFGDAWVSAAFGIYVVMLGLLHAVVRPAERRYRAAMLELAQTPAMAPPERPPQRAELDGLSRRVGAAMGAFNVLLLGALYLMVFKP